MMGPTALGHKRPLSSAAAQRLFLSISLKSHRKQNYPNGTHFCSDKWSQSKNQKIQTDFEKVEHLTGQRQRHLKRGSVAR